MTQAKVNTFCERQGRCILGCLPAARHTLNKTLYGKLFSDPAKGVTLQPLAEVKHIRRVGNEYEVHFLDHRDGGAERSVSAPMVFLGAGVLGTTEVLLRSRDNGGLKLSEKLGAKFSTNGDFGAFALNTSKPVHSTRGPINTCQVQLKVDGVHIKIEDAAIPALFAGIASTALNVLDNFVQREVFKAKMLFAWSFKSLPDLRDFFPLLPDTYDPDSFQTEAEMVSNIFFFNVMAQDDASGEFTLKNDRLHLDWDQPIAKHPVWGTIEGVLKDFSEAMGGKYIPFPLWQGLANKKLIITHPLGGCPIGATNADGVVDEFGRVFDGSKPKGSTDVLPNLYVVDGSVIPGALAANPSLTISAQAIKAVTAAL